jgi:hypothetical protein
MSDEGARIFSSAVSRLERVTVEFEGAVSRLEMLWRNIEAPIENHAEKSGELAKALNTRTAVGQ